MSCDDGAVTGDARLFVLATLDRLDEASGHDIVREATTDQVEQWAHVSTGALYSALRRLETDGHIHNVRDEQIGRYPRRSIFALTPSGVIELDDSRRRTWAAVGLPSDPFDLALSVSDGADPTGLRNAITARLTAYQVAKAALADQLEKLKPYLEPTAAAVIHHMLLRYDTEIHWHQTLLIDVDSFAAARPADPRHS